MAARKSVKKGSVINGWIVEEELTPSGIRQANGSSIQAVRVKRETLSGYVISNLHVTSARYAITGEPGEWQLQKVDSVDWAKVNGTKERRVYKLGGMILREAATVAPLVEGL